MTEYGKIKFHSFSKIENKTFFRNSFFRLVFDGVFANEICGTFS
jgi:hypothetical protein